MYMTDSRLGHPAASLPVQEGVPSPVTLGQVSLSLTNHRSIIANRVRLREHALYEGGIASIISPINRCVDGETSTLANSHKQPKSRLTNSIEELWWWVTSLFKTELYI